MNHICVHAEIEYCTSVNINYVVQPSPSSVPVVNGSRYPIVTFSVKPMTDGIIGWHKPISGRNGVDRQSVNVTLVRKSGFQNHHKMQRSEA